MSEYRELRSFGLVCGGLLALLILTFSQAPLPQVLRLWAALLWLLILPGYALLSWTALRFPLKLAFGIGLQLALLVTLSYWFSWLGLHLKFHGYVLPLLSFGIAFAFHRSARLRDASLLRNF